MWDIKITRYTEAHNEVEFIELFYFFYIKESNSMLACKVVCCSHQSDRRIRVCISYQSDYRIVACISHQSYHSTNHSVGYCSSCKWCDWIRGPCTKNEFIGKFWALLASLLCPNRNKRLLSSFLSSFSIPRRGRGAGQREILDAKEGWVSRGEVLGTRLARYFILHRYPR